MKLRSPSLAFIFLLLTSFVSEAQLIPVTLKQQGTMYFLGGLNRNWFTTSDIQYKGAGYKYNVLGLTSHDRWRPYPFEDWAINTPQFSFRMGYVFRGQAMVGFEFGYDHIRYVVDNNQSVRVSGSMNDTAIVDGNIVFATPQYGLEHANGSSQITLSFVKQFPIVSSKHDAHILLAELKPGGGILMPKSDVRLFGKREIHDLHLAGYLFGLEASIRYTFIQHIALEISGKGSYVNYSNVLTVDGGYATHNYLSFGCFATIGYQFKL